MVVEIITTLTPMSRGPEGSIRDAVAALAELKPGDFLAIMLAAHAIISHETMVRLQIAARFQDITPEGRETLVCLAAIFRWLYIDQIEAMQRRKRERRKNDLREFERLLQSCRETLNQVS
jgi:hypothetical protein